MTNIMKVLVNGTPVTVYSHKGQEFIEGRKGSEYILQISNQNARRVKAVVSVDGISVIDGKPAGSHSTGYIIDPYKGIDIDGWRISNDTVRKFVFDDVEKSYASRAGNSEANVGVIAMRLYQEKAPLWTSSNFGYYPSGCRGLVGTASDLTYNANLGMSVSTSLSQVGTGQGDAMVSHSRKTSFDAESTPYKTCIIYYDSRKGLEQRGIILTRQNYLPNPFPADTGYCQSL